MAWDSKLLAYFICRKEYAIFIIVKDKMKKELKIKYVDIDLDMDSNTESSMQCGGNDLIFEALSKN